jgi:hypothetical protein
MLPTPPIKGAERGNIMLRKYGTPFQGGHFKELGLNGTNMEI